MTVVNEVGVDPNRLLEHPHTVALLQFVCGLGPRKATSLLKVHSFTKVTVNWLLSVADPGEGPTPPVIFRPNIDVQGRRKFFWRPVPSLSQCVDDRPFPPPPTSQNLQMFCQKATYSYAQDFLEGNAE